MEDIFGWSYALMPRMPGRSFSESDWFTMLNMTEQIAVAAALGRTLADIHAATAPIAGSYDVTSDSVTPFPNGYGDWVIVRIETLLAEALTYSPYTTPADARAVRALVAAGRDALSVPYQPCVVMEDYQPGNVTIVGESGRWRVGGVFDLMTLRFGDGEADLARLGRMYAYEEPQLAKAYFSTYFDLRPPRPGFARRFPIYVMHDSLIIWTFCLRRNDIWWPHGYTLRAWINETLELLHALGLPSSSI
jgi:aminoglycoside phosphotransferase (APT) family kinase protein